MLPGHSATKVFLSLKITLFMKADVEKVQFVMEFLIEAITLVEK